MRILFVNKFWKPVGGVEEHCRNLINLLEREGHEVVRFGMHDPNNEPQLPAEQGVGEVSFRSGNARDRLRAAARATLGLETRRAIRNLMREQRFDVAHVVHAYHQLGMTFLPLLRAAGVPIILDLHDYKVGCPRYLLFSDRSQQTCTVCIDRRGAWLWAPSARRCWNGSRASGALLTAEAASARAARAYTGANSVVVHNALQAQAAEHAGVAAERIRVIPHWVADEEPAPPVRGDHVLFVGRLVREKGLDVLVRAAARNGTAVRVAGDGPMRREWESLIAETGADVTMLGWQSHDEVLSELRAAGALVVPSIWPEVWGLVISEAFAAGVPVVASDVGGITDLLAGGRGYLVPANDTNSLASALQRLADQPEEANARARDAREYAREHLSYERWRREYGEVYQALSNA
jgi:glycosyltransferase involved in cell wall biosynthesis